MTWFRRTTLGLGVCLPETVAMQAATPPTDAAVIRALDVWTKRLTDHNGIRFTGSPSSIDPTLQTQGWCRHYPAGVGIWAHFGAGTPVAVGSESGTFPSDRLMWDLKYRGIVPMFNMTSNSDHPTYPSDVWDATGNVYQLVLDGEYDAYIDAWATAALAYASLVNDPDAPIDPAPTNSLKGAALSHQVILRWQFEVNGGNFPWKANDATAAAKFKSAWRYVHDRIRVTNGATNVHMFLNMVNTTATYRTNLSNYGPGASYLQFVGLNRYDKQGDGQPLLFGNKQFQDKWVEAYDLGNGNVPMLVGEWGAQFMDVSDNVPPGAVGRDAHCRRDTSDHNDTCRGWYLYNSLQDLWGRKAQAYKAVKGLFYMDMDLCEAYSDPPPTHYWRAWGIQDGTASGTCGGVAALTGRKQGDATLLGRYAWTQKGPQDGQYRGRPGFFST